jgi:hypothetical protein
MSVIIGKSSSLATSISKSSQRAFDAVVMPEELGQLLDSVLRMMGIFAAQLLPAIAKLVPENARRRAGLIATQVLGMALCRFVLRIPPIVEMPRTELVDWLGPTLQRYLDGE